MVPPEFAIYSWVLICLWFWHRALKVCVMCVFLRCTKKWKVLWWNGEEMCWFFLVTDPLEWKPNLLVAWGPSAGQRKDTSNRTWITGGQDTDSKLLFVFFLYVFCGKCSWELLSHHLSISLCVVVSLTCATNGGQLVKYMQTWCEIYSVLNWHYPWLASPEEMTCS